MFMKNSISFVVWKKETPSNNPAIPPTSAIIERPVTRYVSVLEYLRAIIRYTVFPHIVSAETILFLNLEIQRSQYIRPKVTVHKGVETIQGRKLYEEIR